MEKVGKKLTKELFSEAQTYAQKIVDGLNTAVSPFHSVETVKKLLKDKDFIEIKEPDKWTLVGGQKYFFTRNNTTICAFQVGESCTAGSAPPDCFKIVGCHTDSPTVRVAPISDIETQGYKEVAIQWYGGALWHTWLDRDLTFAGRVIVLNEETGKLEDKFWHHPEPILRIPNLCPHLQGMDERESLKINKEEHLRPVIATSIIDSLMDLDETGEEKKATETESKYSIEKKHLKSFLALMAEGIGAKVENIVDFELSMVDTNKSCIMGLHKEFISSGRLDNMLSSLCATHALLEVSQEKLLDQSVNLIYLFDHEEIGSLSAQGADGSIVNDSLQRIYASFNEGNIDAGYKQALRNSMVISADMAHAIHPNYQHKHQSKHCPKLHQGIVLKSNCNQRYTTDSVSSAIIREICSRVDVPLQDFIVKQDIPCGSTIGPALSANTGIKTVDIGAPQLAMHSCREMCGTTDAYYYHKLFASFFKNLREVSSTLLDH
mmetsp:Transcript_42942/g.50371  ORF Transcript_42942/g.50371 Transcript_42942/m.50371 type:complete len:491 (-) Transcript_42942:15-1487(-)